MGPRLRLWRRVAVLGSILGLVHACAHVPERNPLPEEGVETATVLGIPRVRMWGDEPPQWVHEWMERDAEELKERYPGVYGKPHTYLAISGGGEDGAFAAGVLVGWTAAGDRPEFSVVTGVSAGALVAPFAFLGPEYDDVLRSVSADLRAKDVYNERRLLKAIRSDAMATTDPLKSLIARYVDEEVMEKIAAEYRAGRGLNIGTANLDSMRPVIWRIGAIANSGHPEALNLIRRILLASASIPGAFPPVMIPVEYGGKTYDELHVDGGAASQVFLYPLGLDLEEVHRRLAIPGRAKVYIIRNSRLDPMFERVDNKLFPIAERSLASLVRTQGIGDIYRIFLEACRDKLDFNLAYIPHDFTEEPKESFDVEYMRKLFDMAHERAEAGYEWEKMPPELRAAPIRCH
ncbi:MAG: hypothetical protein AMJ63_09975 [Myxococcales bacterium SG8_38_1]|nr:MAG: hypothetical protein AMJ63_09975 [Myxococcales bacterium SG8_38_1]